jgi:hypothetical protein
MARQTKNKFMMRISIEATSVEAATRLIDGLVAVMTPQEKAQFVKIAQREIKRAMKSAKVKP